MLSGKDLLSSPLVLLEDALSAPSSLVLSGFLAHWRQKQKEICFVSLERPPSAYQSLHAANAESPVKFVDAFTNPLGWKAPAETRGVMQCTDLTSLTALSSAIAKSVTGPSASTCVVFDSGSELVMRHPIPAVAQFLLQLFSIKGISNVLFLLHTDMHDDYTRKALEHVSSAHVKLLVPPKGVAVTASIMLKRKSGKLNKVTEHYNASASGELQQAILTAPTDDSSVSITPNKLDPTRLTSFNTGLSAQERAAKDSVVLPYVHRGEELTPTPLIYGDDEEADDPDADLDI